MFKSIKIWSLMLVLALLLPALVKAEAPPPKNKKEHTYILTSNTGTASVINNDIAKHSINVYSLYCQEATAFNKQVKTDQPGAVYTKVNYICAKQTRKLAGILFMPDKVGWRSYNI